MKHAIKHLSAAVLVLSAIILLSFGAGAYALETPTPEEIISFYNSNKFSVKSEVVYSENYSKTDGSYKPGKLSDATLQQGLNSLNFVRFVAGVPANVTLDSSYNELSQAASLLNAVNNKLTHNPARPANISDSLYEKACTGAQKSNIAWTQNNMTLPLSTAMYADDSDAYNIERVGHRRWILNPSMKKTGFGLVDNYQNTYALDNASGYKTEFTGDFVCWPAQNMPYELYNYNHNSNEPYAFSVSLGSKYSEADENSVVVTLTSQKLGRTWTLDKNDKSTDGEYFNVDISNKGINNCIIFSTGMKFPENDTVTVKVKGLVKSGKAATLSYKVKFFNMFKAFESSYTIKEGESLTLKTGNPFNNYNTYNWRWNNSCVTSTSGTSGVPAATTVVLKGNKAGTAKLTIDSYYTNSDEYHEVEINVVHDYKTTTVKSTCASQGYVLKKCAYCGDEEKTMLPIVEHTAEKTEGYAATCTVPGLTDGTRCSVCGKVITVQQSIEMKPHTDENSDGLCDECGKNACKHTEAVKKGTAATCTKDGLSDGKYCSRCDAVILAQTVIKATGHTVAVKKGTAATCIKSGLTDGEYCSKCNVVITKQKTIAATGHTEVITDGYPATCTEEGLTNSKSCSVCGKLLTKHASIPAKGHKVVATKGYAASCTREGLTDGEHCSSCKTVFVEQEVIPMLSHTDKNVDGICDSCRSFLGLGRPEKFSVKQSKTSIGLAWTAVPKATGYRIFYHNGSAWKKIAQTTTLKTTLTKLTPGTKYNLAVRAYMTVNGSVTWAKTYTVINTATMAAVPSKVTSAQNNTAIKLTWAKSEGADGYRIYYRNGNAWKVCCSSTAKTNHMFSNLKPGTKFTFAVRPYIKTKLGVVWSDYITYTTSTLPEAPVVTYASNKSAISLKWNAVNGATGYRIYYRTSTKASWKVVVKATASTAHMFKNLPSGKTYYFAVRPYVNTGSQILWGSYKPITAATKK